MLHSRLPSADVTVKLGGKEMLGALVGGPPLLPALTRSCRLRSVWVLGVGSAGLQGEGEEVRMQGGAP